MKLPIRFRFGLRWFLVAVTVLCAWLGLHTRAAQRQKAAVARIVNYGGSVRYSYEADDAGFDTKGQSWVPAWARRHIGVDFFHPVVSAHLNRSREPGDWFKSDMDEAPVDCLPDLPSLKNLNLVGEQQVNDENLKFVGRLRHLRHLGLLGGVDVTDAGISHLAKLENLSSLMCTSGALTDSLLTDSSLHAIAGLSSLERLFLQGYKFTDSGVQELSALQNLNGLQISGTPWQVQEITDDSLEFLLALPELHYLGVRYTKVTPEFSQRVIDCFPKCLSLIHI